MHKTYYTVSPCQSRYLQKQVDEAAYERHKKELQKAKPVVDTTPPLTYVHLYEKPKKLQMDAERQAIIANENRLLLEKISYIMKSGSGLDNYSDSTPRSLNSERRKRQLIGVTRENKAIMERVLHSSRDSELANWQADWQRSVERMDRISRYPNNWWERNPGNQTSQSPRKIDRSERQQHEASSKEGGKQQQQKQRDEQKQEDGKN